MGSKSERKKKSHSKKLANEKNPNELYFGYKPNNNRFGDNDLATPFIWKKKWEKTLPGLKGERLRKEVSKRLETRKNLLSSEITEVKKLRAKRQEEQDDMERIREDLQRMADRENFGMLNEKEEEFHKAQVREGAIIRIREEREKAFDEIFKVFLFSNTKENLVVKDLCMVKMFERLKRYKARSYDLSFKDKAESFF